MSSDDIQAANAAAAANYRDDPRWSASRMALSAAIEDASEFNGVVPEHATAWARPGEDTRFCRCSYTNAEAEDHHLICPATTAPPVGERASAVARMALAAPHEAQGGPSAFATGGPAVDDPVTYYSELMKSMGLLSIHDTGARDDGDPTDHDQPSKGGVKRVTDGVYGGQPGGDIISDPAYAHLFTHPPADPATFGQRARGLARS